MEICKQFLVYSKERLADLFVHTVYIHIHTNTIPVTQSNSTALILMTFAILHHHHHHHPMIPVHLLRDITI